eukprot:1007013_1
MYSCCFRSPADASRETLLLQIQASPEYQSLYPFVRLGSLSGVYESTTDRVWWDFKAYYYCMHKRDGCKTVFEACISLDELKNDTYCDILMIPKHYPCVYVKERSADVLFLYILSNND